ncbi:MAG: tripartite tricarboxylate transporter substrate binding protein [Burkholderiales bacterium]|nr:tripartite tricarboxylate transporter substrate binding protein [Burkholderiales bacterium]
MIFPLIWPVALVAGMLLPVPASAADAPGYPARAVRVIAPSSPGSGVDIVSRLVAQKLGANLGQQVVVENRAGAGGNLGAEVAAKAAPDGYTLFMATPSHAINPALYRKLNYDSIRDFAPVGLVMTGQYVLVAHPSLPAKSVKELVALARARPGQLNYASAGNGNATHLAGELLKSLARIDIVHVAYKGSGPALVDLISGQVHFMFPNLVNSLPHIASGRLRALAVTGAKRATAAPHIPTLIEAGVPGYTVMSWYGLLAPAGTPQAVVGRLNSELVKVLRSPDVKERLAGQGADPAEGTPEEFSAFLKEEIAKWGKVV